MKEKSTGSPGSPYISGAQETSLLLSFIGMVGGYAYMMSL
jgi:hypothetical protein